MPDGTTEGEPRRAVGLFESTAPKCPSCGRRFRITVGGEVLITCSSKTRGKACGQKAVVIGIRSVAMVIPVTEEEFDAIQAGEITALSVLARLDLLGVALMDSGRAA